VAKVLRDSLKLVEKQVVQTAQKRDALDAALRRERAARYPAAAVVDSVERVVMVMDSGVRSARDGRDSRDETRTAGPAAGAVHDCRGRRDTAGAGFGQVAGEGVGGS
jgi:hypothetical protein